MRIFDDENSIMNLSILDIKGELLIVSQFTLFANIKKGNRPSYIRAAKSEFAIPFYEKFVKTIAFLSGLNTLTGEFGADMKVKLLNDGPVTILIDTKQRE
jgi:D-tyrosyl-tRNA(Tyr) deacylase